MTKLPEPVTLHRVSLDRYGMAPFDVRGYTEAQMLQFRRDALEEAALVCDEYRYEWRGKTYAQAIRKLKDET